MINYNKVGYSIKFWYFWNCAYIYLYNLFFFFRSPRSITFAADVLPDSESEVWINKTPQPLNSSNSELKKNPLNWMT